MNLLHLSKFITIEVLKPLIGGTIRRKHDFYLLKKELLSAVIGLMFNSHKLVMSSSLFIFDKNVVYLMKSCLLELLT